MAFCMVLCLVVIPASVSFAGPPLVIVRGQDFPPYHYQDSTGKETGFLIELITMAARSMGTRVQFRQYPWSRCLKLVEAGEADAMMNLFRTPERETFMAFPDTPLTREVNRFFLLDGDTFAFDGNLATLTGRRIDAVRNYSYGKRFDHAAGQLKILRLETEKALILNLLQHRCDIILGNDLVIRTLAKGIQGGSRIRPTGPGITDDPLYIGFSKARGHQETARAFSRALQQVKASTEFKARLAAYGISP